MMWLKICGIIPQPSKIDRYFATPLFVWMPRKVMQVKVCCPGQGCSRELTSAGLNRRTRSILCMKYYYNIVAEYLECTVCKKKYISWDNRIISQLDMARQQLFPTVPTYRQGMVWNGRRFFHIPYWQFSSIPFPFHTKNLPFHIPFLTKIFFHIPFHTKIFFHIPFHTSIRKKF